MIFVGTFEFLYIQNSSLKKLFDNRLFEDHNSTTVLISQTQFQNIKGEINLMLY